MAVSGYYGFGNAGDEAVLAGILRSLRDRCPKAEIVVFSGDPAGTEEEHGVKAVGRMNGLEVLATLRNADLLISGGGSLLQDVTSARSALYYLAVIWLAKRLGKKVMVYAQGIGPLHGKAVRSVARRVLNRVDLITVRDEDSRRYLMDLGVTAPEVRVTADPSFAVEPASYEEADEILRTSGVPDGAPLIGVALRPWHGQSQWLPGVARGLETASSTLGATLVFLPMQRDQDRALCVQIASLMTSPSVVVSAPLTPSQVLALIGRMNLVVGMRLHALIFAASVGVPFLGISYDPKIDAFAKATTGEDPVQLPHLDDAAVWVRIIDAWERRDELAAHATTRTRELRSAALANADLACALIEA